MEFSKHLELNWWRVVIDESSISKIEITQRLKSIGFNPTRLSDNYHDNQVIWLKPYQKKAVENLNLR